MPQASAPLILFIINPISGGKGKQDWETAIAAFLKDKPFRSEIFLLSKDNDGDSVMHYIETLQPVKIVAVGGDGTVKMLAQKLAGTSYCLGILPAGSANGMAKELGIGNDVNEALNIIISGEEKQVDVIEINNKHICLHLSDIGLNAQLIRYYENHPSRGMLSYARFLFKTLWNKQRFQVTLQSGEKQTSRDAYMVVLANARMYGTGAAINPHGDVSDGSFEIVILKQISIIEAVKMLLKSKALNRYKTEIIRVNEVSLQCNKPVHFQIDGEYMGKTTHLTARIKKNVLKLMVPAENKNPNQ